MMSLLTQMDQKKVQVDVGWREHFVTKNQLRLPFEEETELNEVYFQLLRDKTFSINSISRNNMFLTLF